MAADAGSESARRNPDRLPTRMGRLALLLFALVFGLGASPCATSGGGTDPPPDQSFDSAYFCSCTCVDPDFTTNPIQYPALVTCMSVADNGNVNGGLRPSLDDLALDCAFRVCPAMALALDDKLKACGYSCEANGRTGYNPYPKPACNAFGYSQCNVPGAMMCNTSPTSCGDNGQCLPAFCTEPPGELLGPREFLDRGELPLALAENSTITIENGDARGSTTLSGFGLFTGGPCPTSNCLVSGSLGATLLPFGFGAALITDARLSFTFSGLSSATGNLVIPGSSAEVVVLLEVDGPCASG